MSTITDLSAVRRIQDELKTLSPQELRMIEFTVHNLQKVHAASEKSKSKDNDLDFDEDGWLHPKPGAAKRFIELCRENWNSHCNEDYDQLRLERILGEETE
ncbi:MAG: hypothetical protein LBC02_04870 [Planctomycetaceae bacterium]|jgi:hypothetical protein|nr:hypothetical protein [Planctomycetaceae bacterium]